MEVTPKPPLLDHAPDLLARYAVTALLLKPWVRSLNRPARVLEVGCNVIDWLPDLLAPLPVEVVRCDVQDHGGNHFVLIRKDAPLPFADSAFDFTVALEVLEHVPPQDRPFAVSEWLRVAARGMVLSCPNGVRAVRDAERRADRAYRQRHGRPHPWLKEHAEHGLPTPREMAALFERLEVPYRVLDHAPVAEWLPLLLLTEELTETCPSEAALFNSRFNERPPTRAERAVPYRKIYLCFKDAEQEREARPLWGALHSVDLAEGPALDPTVALAHSLRHIFHRQGSELIEQQRQLARFHEEARQRECHVAALECRAQEAEFRHEQAERLLRRVALELDFERRGLASWLQPLLGRLRRRWLFGRPGWGLGPVVPCPLLMRLPASEPLWEAWDGQACFHLERAVPAGWVRLEAVGHFPAGTVSKVAYDDGSGFSDKNLVALGPWTGPGRLVRYLYLERPVRRWRFHPVPAAVSFVFHGLDVRPCGAGRLLLGGLGKHLKECWNPRWVLNKVRKLAVLLGRGGGIQDQIVRRAALAERPPGQASSGPSYEEWLARHALTEEDRRRMHDAIAAAGKPPRLALLLCLPSVDAAALALTLRSLREQHYDAWELRIAVAEEGTADLEAALAQAPWLRERTTVEAVRGPFRVSAALNGLLGQAEADHVLPVDAGDELEEGALLAVADALARHPAADFLYSDEGERHPVEGKRRPHCKPDWSPDYYLARPYTGRLAAYRADACRRLGGFRPEFEGGHEFDLVLRLTAGGGRNVCHLARILVHRAAERTDPLPEAAARVVEHHLTKNTFGVAGRVERGDSTYRVRFAIPASARVSVVMITAGRWARLRGQPRAFVTHGVESIRTRTTYGNYEILVVDNGDLGPEVARTLDGQGVRRVSCDGPVNLAAKMNLGARHAEGDYLLFLNDDLEVIAPDWLEGLLEYACQPGVGVVGAKLLSPDGRLQHVGVWVQDGNPGHFFYQAPSGHPGYFDSTRTPRNYLAVTGACLMTPRAVFDKLGGFDPQFPFNFNDVDYCLRAHEAGWRVVFTPYAQLYHYDGASRAEGRVLLPGELARLHAIWKQRSPRDPYYNDNLSTVTWDYRLKP